MISKEQLEKFKKGIKSIKDLSKYIPNKLGLSEKERDAANIIFWLIYLIEDILRKKLNELNPTNYNENKFHRLTFGQKISKIEKFLQKEGSYENKKEFINVARKINQIRRDIIHQNKPVKEICYDNKSITQRETQEQMFVDFYSSTDP